MKTKIIYFLLKYLVGAKAIFTPKSKAIMG